MTTANHQIIDTVVVGAGHAGLAVSRLLTAAGRDHVVLDRGRTAERWRSERWDSLHLLTPNWLTRLPGHEYTGPDPEGFMAKADFVRMLEAYAASFGAPVNGGTTVQSVTRTGDRYDVRTDTGSWRARHVVVATGAHGTPVIPSALQRTDVEVVAANQYRNPAELPAGGVLVVGASSTGVQIADELRRAGRDVVLSVGRHTRMPRRYRGMDVFWWLERTGRLSRTIDAVPDREAARREPSLQLVGRNGTDETTGLHGGNLDLAALHRRGVRLTARLEELSGRTAYFGAGLAGTIAKADDAMHRFLDAVDRHVHAEGLDREVWPADRPAPFTAPDGPPSLDLGVEGIGTVVLATGYRPDHSWLELPILEPDGSIRQYRGVTAAPGLYVVGQRFQHRRDSGFIDGARHGADDVVTHLLTGCLPGQRSHQGEEAAR